MQTLDCEVCKRLIGFGSLEILPPLLPTSTSAISSTSLPVPSSPQIATEPVCASCNSKYLFCSECGGGGRSRTGKYRPRELFEPNRRTCSLPHVRIGDAEVKYRTVEVPREMSEEVVRGCQDVFFDCLISLYAVPNVMEERFGGDYSGVKREVEGVWKRTVMDVVYGAGGKGTSGGDGLGGEVGNQSKQRRRKYLTIAWIEKRHRNKAKVKKDGSDEQVPWLTRLALEGTVAPTTHAVSVGASGSDAGTATPPETRFANPLQTSMSLLSPSLSSTSTRCYVAFSISEWDPPHKALLMIQMAPRSVFLPTMESYGELLRRAMERVQADGRKDDLPALEHIWCWTRGEKEHVRLDAVPERMGFTRKEEYLATREGTVDPVAFERPEWGVLREEGVKIWVKNAADLARGRGKVD
ncbi:hypothetical protein HK097_003974 [Rhizophlyctis rosea]|uniref:Uncharacterized protein n=1 Tax=Rhizophlyctis rosea TaxID=64517 RepID=A0AAD5SG99_9FUNG|nr:hypothetical protein HK097_003974 [Rhizophlyctis rosea]